MNESSQEENVFVNENSDVTNPNLLESDHTCSKCGHSFTSRETLHKHMENVHEGKKPHKCNFCEARFYQSFSLKKHISSVHKGKKMLKKSPKKSSEAPKYEIENEKFKCVCGALFSTKRTFGKHFAAVHEGKKPHQCTTCDASFSSAGYLKVCMVIQGINFVKNKTKYAE